MNKRPTCLQLPHNAPTKYILLCPAGFRGVSCAQNYLGHSGAVFDSMFTETSLKLQGNLLAIVTGKPPVFNLT